MDITQEKVAGTLALRITGRIDANTSSELEVKLRAVIDAGERRFALDFANVDYISSAGLRVLLSAAKQVGGDGIMAIHSLSTQVKKVFDIAGFSSVLNCFESETEALRRLGSHA